LVYFLGYDIREYTAGKNNLPVIHASTRWTQLSQQLRAHTQLAKMADEAAEPPAKDAIPEGIKPMFIQASSLDK